ncbi:MAG: V-type ATP synthase subunit I [Thermoplasmata archaeon]
MIKPERMARIAIVGPRSKLDIVIQSLYELNLFHLVDFLEEDPEVKIGAPLEKASVDSQKLLKLRAIIRALHLDDFKPDRKIPVEEIEKKSDQLLTTLDLEVTDKIENRQNISSKIRDLQTKNNVLSMFEAIGLSLECYSGYDSISVFIGTAQQPVREKIESTVGKKEFSQMEVIEIPYDGAYAVAVFCKKRLTDSVREVLNLAGYQEIRPPESHGSPSELIATYTLEIEKLQAALEKADESIEILRKKYGAFLLAAEEHYSIEVLKAETPLRIATTKHSFTIDGWVPKSSYDELKKSIHAVAGDSISIEDLTVTETEENETAPVKLRNILPARPFELFIELMSKPLYREIDPTIFVFTVFPLFFGLMIGDFGYGACLMLAGFVMYSKLGKDSDGWRRLGQIVLLGGFFAAIFGLFLFCDAFGLPFHPVHNEEGELVLGGLSWEAIGVNIPMEAHMEKLVDVKDLLAISVFAAWLHMSVGLGLGFVNEMNHDRKHAAMKVLWLVILLGLFMQILFMARGSELRNGLFLAFCGPFQSYVMPFSGMSISIVALILILIGIAGFFALHGRGAMMEVLEILSLLSNVISYTRIAAIGVAKGAMALAFNYIVINYLFAGGNVVIIIAGVIVLILLQLLVFALGSLSAGIQALRLNYVEFFLKFYNGGGVDFEPLGYKRRFSKESEV